MARVTADRLKAHRNDECIRSQRNVPHKHTRRVGVRHRLSLQRDLALNGWSVETGSDVLIGDALELDGESPVFGLTLLLTWLIAHALQFRWAFLAMRRSSEDAAPSRLTALQFSLVASCASLLTLAIFLWVFVIGGSSNVAQMAGPSGLKLWAFWGAAWPFMLMANPLALLFLVVSACCPPYPGLIKPQDFGQIGVDGF